MTGTRVRGWSAQRWAESMLPALQVLAGWLAIDLGLWAAVFITGTNSVWTSAALLWTESGVALMAVFLILNLWTVSRARAEARQGYTSARNAYPELAQVAPGSTFVIRPAGGPYLDDESYFAAIASARAAGHRIDSALRPRSSASWIWVPFSTIGVVLTGFVIYMGVVGTIPVLYPIVLVGAIFVFGTIAAIRMARQTRA